MIDAIARETTFPYASLPKCLPLGQNWRFHNPDAKRPRSQCKIMNKSVDHHANPINRPTCTDKHI
jgi:hypothetical protein